MLCRHLDVHGEKSISSSSLDQSAQQQLLQTYTINQKIQIYEGNIKLIVSHLLGNHLRLFARFP